MVLGQDHNFPLRATQRPTAVPSHYASAQDTGRSQGSPSGSEGCLEWRQGKYAGGARADRGGLEGTRLGAREGEFGRDLVPTGLSFFIAVLHRQGASAARCASKLLANRPSP